MITHPAAELFPLLNDAELKDLADDIKKNGLLEPIVTYEGMLLDGRNRLRACELAGIQPRFIALDHERESAVSYVASKNLYRRQLTPAQRASIANALAELLNKEQKKGGVSRDTPPSQDPSRDGSHSSATAIRIAAEIMKVSPSSIERVRRIKARDIDTFNAIKSGNMTIEEGLRKVGLSSKPSKKPKSNPLPKRGTPEWVIAVDQFFETLCANIIRIRKENKDEMYRRRWNPEDVSKRTQTELLDWIEEQLKAGRQLITGVALQ